MSETPAGSIDVLGPLIAWQIRDMPKAVRDAIVDQARIEDVKVPDLLTRLILEAQGAGWTMAHSTANGIVASPSRPRAALSDVLQIAQAMATMAGAGLPLPKQHVQAVTRALQNSLPRPLDSADAHATVARIRNPAEQPLD